MFIKLHTDSKRRFILTAAASFLALTACGNDGSTAASSGGSSAYEVAGDHAIGNPDASVTVVEYASVVCGACANFHQTVYPDFKKKYIDSGLVRFVFREYPTSPENLAQAGFLIANCAPEGRFFDSISLQFKRQRQIFKAAGDGTVRQEYVAIAKSSGLSEAEFDACLQNQEEIDRYKAVVQGGIDAGVSGTPSFFINGELVKRTASGKQLFTMETWDEHLAPLLGDDAPAPDVKAETGSTESGADTDEGGTQ
jgi:protein-disulfide isomerase